MPLLGASTLMGYLQTYRQLHIKGRYGGGKTSLAYRLAYDLCQHHGYRYIVSNIGSSASHDASVWHDQFADVKLREGQYADTVVILDEAGIFLKTGQDADAFIAFLRKLNICLLMPSVHAPATKLRMLSCQRLFNLSAFGVPMWIYRLILKADEIKEVENFYWWRPDEIYGVYDTNAFVDGDGGLSDFINSVTVKAAANAGYRLNSFGTGAAGSVENGAISFGRSNGVAGVDQSGRVAAAFLEAAETMEGVSSVLASTNNKKRRR